MPTGYCTVEDLRRVLRDKNLPGDISQDTQIAIDAITGQTGWLQGKTGHHFYVPGGINEDDDNLVPTEPLSHESEEHDIPSTPHPQHSQLFNADRSRYPRRMNGPYTRVRLDKHAAVTVTALEVRDSGGQYTDWVADSGKTEGEDYELYVEPGSTSSPSYVDLHVSSLPPLQHYDSAVRVSYDFGLDELPSTIRRAVAMKAVAELLTDDEAALGIPENANLVTAETKIQTLERQAEEKLEAYL